METVNQNAVPASFLQSPQPDTGFRGVNLQKPPQKIPINDCASLENMWIIGGQAVTRPGLQGILAAKMAVALTDLVIDGTNLNQVTSALRPFTSDDVGGTLNITSGTNFTVGSPKITSVVSGKATLTANAGTVLGSTGGHASFNAPIYEVTEFAAADTSNPPNITSLLVFGFNSKLYMMQVGSTSAPTEVKIGGTSGTSFSLNGRGLRLLFEGQYLYMIDGVGPLYQINIPYINPLTAYTCAESVALVAPTAALKATLTNQVIDANTDIANWAGMPSLNNPYGGTVNGSIELVTNTNFTGASTHDTDVPPTGFQTGGDSMDFNLGPNNGAHMDPGTTPQWVDWDAVCPDYYTPYLYTDLVLVSGGGGLTVSSAGRPFRSTDVGTILYVTAGTGFTKGPYYIASVSNLIATLASSAGTATSTGGHARLMLCNNTIKTARVYVGAVQAALTTGNQNTFDLQCYAEAASILGTTTVVTGGGQANYAAPYKYDDLVIASVGTNVSTVSSSERPFIANDIGMSLTITGGTNFTIGGYTITSVTTGVATLNGVCGTVSSTGGTGVRGLDSSTNAWGHHNYTLTNVVGENSQGTEALSGIPGGFQDNQFTCTSNGVYAKDTSIFSLNGVSTDPDFVRFRMFGPANPGGVSNVVFPSFVAVDARLIPTAAANGTLHVTANAVNNGGFCLGGAWLKKDYTNATTLTVTDLAIANSNTSQVSSASHTFVSGDIGKAISVIGGSGTQWIMTTATILSVSAGAATLSVPVSNSTSSTGGIAVFSTVKDFSQSNIISMSYSAPATSGQIPIRFGFLQPGLAYSSIKWSNPVSYSSDGGTIFVDISTLGTAFLSQVAYFFIQITSDFAAIPNGTTSTLNLADICTLGPISGSGNLTLNSLYGGLGAGYFYQYTEINASLDSVFFLNVIESDPSPVSTPVMQPNGVSNEVELAIPPAVNPTSTHIRVYQGGGEITDGQLRSLGTVSLTADTAFADGTTVWNYTDLVIGSGLNTNKVSSVARPFVAGDVGTLLQITGGSNPGFVPGTYPIASVAAGVATLGLSSSTVGIASSTVVGVAGSTGGTANLVVPTSTISWNHSTRKFAANTPDSALLSNTPTFLLSGRTGAPVGCTAIGSIHNRIVLIKGASVFMSWSLAAGVNSGLYYNTINVPDPNDVAQSIKGGQYSAGGINDPAMAVVPMGSYLIISKQRSVYQIVGTNAAAFDISPHLKLAGSGLIAPKAWALVNSRLWFEALDGIREYDGADMCRTVSKDIEPRLNPFVRNLPALNTDAVYQSFMGYHGGRVYLVTPGQASDTTPQVCWVWDPWTGYNTNALSEGNFGVGGWVGPWDGFAMTSVATLTGAANTGDLFFGGRDGQIYQSTGNGDKSLSGSTATTVTVNFLSRAFGQESLGTLYFREDRANYVNVDVTTNESNVTVTLSLIPVGGETGGTTSLTYTLATAGQYGLRLPLSADCVGMNIQVGVSAATVSQFVISSIALETVDASPNSVD